MNTTIQQGKALPMPTDKYEKGRLFEKYIITLFNQQSFKVQKWRESRRIQNGVYPLDLCYPDLELVFMGKRNHCFAIECKWKARFWNKKISWATEKRRAKYLEFQNNFNGPVFIAIGIGGHPSAPERLFVTPLQYISHKTEVREDELIPYYKKPTHKFFYDTVQLKLF